jgi:chromosome partitioning protein
MGAIVCVAQRKGGVGKTTLAISIASELASRGRDVALADGDPQGSACHWAEPGELLFPVYEIPLERGSVAAWLDVVRGVEANCIVIDTAPSDRALGASIAIADLVIVPCTPSGLDIEATARTLGIISAVRVRRGHVPALILAPNRVDIRTLEGRQLVEALADFGETVAPAIGDRSAFVRAFSAGRSVADIARGTAAEREIAALCDLVEANLPDAMGTTR